MEVEYIIVQAGGRGSRMGKLTSNKPKALVPINNLPIIFYLFQKFPQKKFVIIADYKCDVMKKYLYAFSKVEYLIVNTNGKKGTCSGISTALNLIPQKSAFMIVWSDLLLSDSFQIPKYEGNYIGISKEFECRWSYLNDCFEEKPSSENGVAGLFVFSSKAYLGNVPVEGEFVKWLQKERMIFQPVCLYKTKEYGLITEWNKLKVKQVGRCRPFNKICITDKNTLIKEGIDEQGKDLSFREKTWYRFVITRGFSYIPQIYSFTPFEMERIEGSNVFEYNFSFEEKKMILKYIVERLRKLHQIDSKCADYFSIYDTYVKKTFRRLEKVRDLIPFSAQRYITINERKCHNIFFYKEQLEKAFECYICDSFHVIHGDNTFSNILLDAELNPIFIDPRGYFGATEIYGDVAYDWAKLYYSIVGNYDNFNIKDFELEIGENQVNLYIKSNGWEDTEPYFWELLKDEVCEKNIKLIHAVIWLSLTTYAWEDYDSICGAFYNGLFFLEESLQWEKEREI